MSESLTLYGGAVLRVAIDGKAQDFWNEFVRVSVNPQESMVFRVITRAENWSESSLLQGIRTMLPKFGSTAPPHRAVLDSRSNIEREIDLGAGEEFTSGEWTDIVIDQYKRLLSGDINFFLMPVREGSLGQVDPIGSVAPFTTRQQVFDVNAWDVREEAHEAERLNQILQSPEQNKRLLWNLLRDEISQRTKVFAFPLLQLLGASFEMMPVPAEPAVLTTQVSLGELGFNGGYQSKEVSLGGGNRLVERTQSYIFPTPAGKLYIQVLRVWNAERSEFESIRVVQTHPDTENIYGLRIDSSCVDGVHALDAHCDCAEQLEVVLRRGIDRDKNTMVIQMLDHEGKGWGTVMKSATHMVVRSFNAKNTQQTDHVEGSEWLYQSFSKPGDIREYSAAQHVLAFLGISHVETLLMENQSKTAAVTGAGVSYDRREAPDVSTKVITQEAAAALRQKHNSRVTGLNGTVHYGETGVR